MSQEFREYLRESLDRNGVSIQELSRRTGVTAGYIARLMSEEHYPSTEVLRKLSVGLGIDYLTLMRKVGYVEGNISMPDLYQLILSNQVTLGGTKIKNLEHAKRICNIIYSVLDLNDDYLEDVSLKRSRILK